MVYDESGNVFNTKRFLVKLRKINLNTKGNPLDSIDDWKNTIDGKIY